MLAPPADRHLPLLQNLFMLRSMSRSRADEVAMLASVLRCYFALRRRPR